MDIQVETAEPVLLEEELALKVEIFANGRKISEGGVQFVDPNDPIEEETTDGA